MRTRFSFEKQLEWQAWVTPKHLREAAIHRWYVFPHSFTPELVQALIEEWALGLGDRILDPFVGAGTTLLAAKQAGVGADGYDLSPLAVFASRVKTRNYKLTDVKSDWSRIRRSLARSSSPSLGACGYATLIRDALDVSALSEIERIACGIRRLSSGTVERDFFSLALLSIVPRHSRAVATGGWLAWRSEPEASGSVLESFEGQVEMMLSDLENVEVSRIRCNVSVRDCRALQRLKERYSAVITSPPYPNRHDYTRIFGVELLLKFVDVDGLRQLRYQSFHSHPESRPLRPSIPNYRPPAGLPGVLNRLRSLNCDKRVIAMLSGYFKDMYVTLRQIGRVSKRGAPIALVLGNAQYMGEAVPVDEYTADVAEQVGLRCDRIRVVRFRGNSAQQMGAFGRRPARESIVLLRK